MARRSHRSLGELISSFSFLLVGVYFGLSAPELWAEGQAFKAILLGGVGRAVRVGRDAVSAAKYLGEHPPMAKITPARNPASCHGCRHFFVTHNRQRPWGCRKFGFTSMRVPAQEILATTGTECAYFHPKPPLGSAGMSERNG